MVINGTTCRELRQLVLILTHLFKPAPVSHPQDNYWFKKKTLRTAPCITNRHKTHQAWFKYVCGWRINPNIDLPFNLQGCLISLFADSSLCCLDPICTLLSRAYYQQSDPYLMHRKPPKVKKYFAILATEMSVCAVHVHILYCVSTDKCLRITAREIKKKNKKQNKETGICLYTYKIKI